MSQSWPVQGQHARGSHTITAQNHRWQETNMKNGLARSARQQGTTHQDASVGCVLQCAPTLLSERQREAQHPEGELERKAREQTRKCSNFRKGLRTCRLRTKTILSQHTQTLRFFFFLTSPLKRIYFREPSLKLLCFRDIAKIVYPLLLSRR